MGCFFITYYTKTKISHCFSTCLIAEQVEVTFNLPLAEDHNIPFKWILLNNSYFLKFTNAPMDTQFTANHAKYVHVKLNELCVDVSLLL